MLNGARHLVQINFFPRDGGQHEQVNQLRRGDVGRGIRLRPQEEVALKIGVALLHGSLKLGAGFHFIRDENHPSRPVFLDQKPLGAVGRCGDVKLHEIGEFDERILSHRGQAFERNGKAGLF